MADLALYQYILIALIFVWGGFVRSGLGFGGAVFSLPFLLMIVNQPLLWLPIIAIQLLFFSALTVIQNQWKTIKADQETQSTIDWKALKKTLSIMIIPKLIGVFGLFTLPAELLSAIIFIIVIIYSLSYILNKPFSSKNKTVDWIFLVVGGYVSGTSLIGAPLITAVLANHINRFQLRDTLFVLWFILVTIKMTTFVIVGVDLQLIHQLWLLPVCAIGHIIGLSFHKKMLESDPTVFYRRLGVVLIVLSSIGLVRSFY
jgi:uncharacterized membrane protein YfcA